jgi:hypothetical protein
MRALLIAYLLCAGCALGTRRPDGAIYCAATGNAAWSYCAPDAPPRMAAIEPVQPMPIPTPIMPTVKPGCVVCQGGAEAGSTLGVLLGIIFGALVL